jgi:hypothetical protein
MIRPVLALVAVCALAALTAAGTASAAAPTLLTVGESGGNATATWSLAPGAQAWTIEVATSPALDTDGSFVSENVVDIHVFMDQSTSWTGTTSLDPGTYYVHISGSSCASCGDVSWSAVESFTVGGSSTTTTGTQTTTAETTTAATTTTSPTTTTPGTETTTTPAPTTTTPTQPGVAPPPYDARRPSIQHAEFGLAAGRIVGTLSVCNRAKARLVVRTLVRRGRAHVASRAHLAAAAAGCWPYLVRARAPRGSGPVTVTMRVGDGTGAWSRPISRRIR